MAGHRPRPSARAARMGGCALTGARIKAADCELLGIATDFVETARLGDLKAAILADPPAVETLLTQLLGAVTHR